MITDRGNGGTYCIRNRHEIQVDLLRFFTSNQRIMTDLSVI